MMKMNVEKLKDWFIQYKKEIAIGTGVVLLIGSIGIGAVAWNMNSEPVNKTKVETRVKDDKVVVKKDETKKDIEVKTESEEVTKEEAVVEEPKEEEVVAEVKEETPVVEETQPGLSTVN